MIVLKMSVRYPQMTGLIALEDGLLITYNRNSFSQQVHLSDFKSSFWIGCKPKESTTRSIIFPSYGFSIFFASEGPIFTKKFLSVSESIVFVISDFPS